MTEALAPASRTASATVLKTGMPSCVVPPLPGVTPPTTCVPYSTICFVWNVPSLPVTPCTTSRVFLSTRTLNVLLLGDPIRIALFEGGVYHACAPLQKAAPTRARSLKLDVIAVVRRVNAPAEALADVPGHRGGRLGLAVRGEDAPRGRRL